MDTPIGQSTVGDMLPFLIIMAILLLIIIFCIRMAIVTSKAKKQGKVLIKEQQAQGMSIHIFAKHVNGLPIAENLVCQIYSFPDKLEIRSGTTNITLSRNKITDMCIKTDTEIQQQTVSSVGGAVAGAVLFGPLGAVIGGRAKNKTTKTVNHYLIITYTNEQGSLSYIGFDVTASVFKSTKLIKEFHELNTNSGTHIEL